jgi:hypothetical protein
MLANKSYYKWLRLYVRGNGRRRKIYNAMHKRNINGKHIWLRVHKSYMYNVMLLSMDHSMMCISSGMYISHYINVIDDIIKKRRIRYGSLVRSLFNIVNYIDVINRLSLIRALRNVWGNWIEDEDVVDCKNIVYTDMNQEIHPLFFKPWEKHRRPVTYIPSITECIYSNMVLTIYGGYSKDIFKDIYWYKLYIRVVHMRPISFHDRPYYCINDRYLDWQSRMRYRTYEIKRILDPRVKIRKAVFHDKMTMLVRFKKHHWKVKMIEWVNSKTFIKDELDNMNWSMSRTVDMYADNDIGIEVYDMVSIHVIYTAWLTYYYGKSSSDEIEYFTQVYNRYKSSYEEHGKEKYVIRGILTMCIDADYSDVFDIRMTSYYADKYATHVLSDNTSIAAIQELCNDDITMRNTVYTNKVDSWVHMSDGWIKDADRFIIHLSTYRYISEYVMCKEYMNVSTDVYMYSVYWYNRIYHNNAIRNTALIRLISYDYITIVLSMSIDSDINSRTLYDHNTVIRDVILSLVDNSHIDDINSELIYNHSIRHMDIYNLCMLNKYVDGKDMYVYSVFNDTFYTDIVDYDHGSMHIYGVIEHDIYYNDLSNIYECMYTSFIYVSANNYYINKYRNDRKNMKKYLRAIRSSFRKVWFDNSYYKGLANANIWRTKLEWRILIKHKYDMKSLNKYKYNKAIINSYDEDYINPIILDSLKKVKIIPDEYNGHWSDTIANPFWYNVRNILLRAKFGVLRMVIRWSNVDIRNYFLQQEHWERFIRNEDIITRKPFELYFLFKFHGALKKIYKIALLHKMQSYVRYMRTKAMGIIFVHHRLIYSHSILAIYYHRIETGSISIIKCASNRSHGILYQYDNYLRILDMKVKSVPKLYKVEYMMQIRIMQQLERLYNIPTICDANAVHSDIMLYWDIHDEIDEWDDIYARIDPDRHDAWMVYRAMLHILHNERHINGPNFLRQLVRRYGNIELVNIHRYPGLNWSIPFTYK